METLQHSCSVCTEVIAVVPSQSGVAKDRYNRIGGYKMRSLDDRSKRFRLST